MWTHQLHTPSKDTPKLKQPSGLKLAKLFEFLILYEHVMVYTLRGYAHHNISKIPPHIGLYLLFCIAWNCQFRRLICGKFCCWAAISYANMHLALEIQKWNSLQTLKVKRWQLHSLHLLACKKLICLNLLVQHLFLIHKASRVRGFKQNETIQSKTLLSDGYLACKIENEN